MKRNEAMDVYKGRLEKFKNTQSIQWKMNLSIWTLLALAIYYNGPINKLNTCFLLFLLGSICVIHFCYCLKTQESLNDDKAVNDDIVKRLNKKKKRVKVRFTKKGEFSLTSFYWIILQTAITGVLVALIFFQSYS